MRSDSAQPHCPWGRVELEAAGADPIVANLLTSLLKYLADKRNARTPRRPLSNIYTRLRRMRRQARSLILITLFWSAAISAHQPADPVDLVSPYIGSIGQLLSSIDPYVLRPHGMARISPITTPGISDRYLADSIYGLRPAMLMASTGHISTEASLVSTHRAMGPASTFPISTTFPAIPGRRNAGCAS